MALSEFHQQQNAILRTFIAAMARLLGLVAGKPLSDEQYRDLVAVLTETVNSARQQLVPLAFEQYLAVRPEGAEEIAAPTLNPYPAEYFEKVVRTFRDTLEAEDGSEAAVTRITQAATRSVQNAGRETIQAATRYDPEALGWARVLTGAESCGWCAMLASRGPVYNTRKSAGAEDEWHLGCDCIAVPVFRGQETAWEGYAEYRRLEKLWGSATKGTSGKASLRKFDRAFGKEDPTNYSPLKV